MKLGALDYLQKPFEIDELLVVVAAGARAQRLRTASRLPDQRARRAVRSLRHRRPQPRRCRRWCGRAELVAQSREHGADHRRDRHRQGAGRARDPRPQRAARHAARSRQLRGAAGDADRVRAVRPRARRVHRRGRRTEGLFALADGGTIFLDEIGDAGADAAGQAAARAAGARVRAARRRSGPRRSTSASSPRRTAISGRWSPTAGSGTISTTGST